MKNLELFINVWKFTNNQRNYNVLRLQRFWGNFVWCFVCLESYIYKTDLTTRHLTRSSANPNQKSPSWEVVHRRSLDMMFLEIESLNSLKQTFLKRLCYVDDICHIKSKTNTRNLRNSHQSVCHTNTTLTLHLKNL